LTNIIENKIFEEKLVKNKRLLKLIVPISLVAVLAIALPLAGGCRPAPAPVKPITIGAIFCRTGYVNMIGEDAYRATVLAMEQADYKVAGTPIDFIWEDNASDATVTMDKAKKLIETDKISVFTGMTLTAGFDVIGPYLTRMNIPSLSTSTVTIKQALAGWPLWSHSGTMNQTTYTTGVYAYEVLGYRTASTLGFDAEFARGYVDGFKEGFESRGGTVVQSQWVPLDVLDFSPYFMKVADADVFVYQLIGAGVVTGTKQIREVGLWDRMPVMMPYDAELFDAPVLSQVGKDALGIIACSHWSVDWDTPGNQDFVKAYTERWGVAPGVYGAKAYVSAQIIFNAIERTGGDVSFEALSKALDETDMDTIRGHITFTDHLGAAENWIMESVRITKPSIEVRARYWAESAIVDGKVEVRYKLVK
jgi:branched-chain amino acid transport system substrate-binding protein